MDYIGLFKEWLGISFRIHQTKKAGPHNIDQLDKGLLPVLFK